MQAFLSEWRCPSNIALVKYWGKKAGQIPGNPSISFTLSSAYTQTRLEAYPHQKSGLEFYLDQQREPRFETKIQSFFKSLREEIHFLNQLYFKIYSHNSFPHSAGIASSASAMGALALCLSELEEKFTEQRQHNFIRRASFLGRLGSGSASRSLIPQIALWGKHADIVQSSDQYAVGLHEVDPRMHRFYDYILIIDSQPKAVSSSAGHQLMEQHIYADRRYNQANENINRLLIAMKEYDLEQFIEIVEEEAMTLHALMMCSRPGYLLMRPNTLQVIQSIREYRKNTGIPIAFTLDAGPNVHVLFPAEFLPQAEALINQELLQYCEDRHFIKDKVGMGPQKILSNEGNL